DNHSRAFSLPCNAAFIYRAILPCPSLPVIIPQGASWGLLFRINVDHVGLGENCINARTGTAADHDELAFRNSGNCAVARRGHGSGLSPCAACKIEHEMVAKGARRTPKLS